MGPGASDLPLLLKAAHFAAHKHRGQRRKDAYATPYINHPLEVAELLAAVGKVTDIETLCAGLLHDTIEDTDTTAEELEREFGKEITSIVLEVTDDKSLAKDERKRLQIENAAKKSTSAKLIKLGDKISNIRCLIDSPPRHWPAARQRKYVIWAREVVVGLRGVQAALESRFDKLCIEAEKAFQTREPKELNYEQALEIARKEAPKGKEVSLHDGLSRSHILFDGPEYCWCASYWPWDEMILASSNIILISKTTGEVLYHGSANDEG